MEYVRVCAIDAGYRNFAYCIVDNLSWNAPLVWRKEDLWGRRKGTPTNRDLIAITQTWCENNREMLGACDCILLEKQMRIPFIVMNTVIQAHHFNASEVISPNTFGAFFKLPKKRIPKKMATIELCQKHTIMPDQYDKIDDLADAWMMSVWGLIKRGAISKSEIIFLQNKTKL